MPLEAKAKTPKCIKIVFEPFLFFNYYFNNRTLSEKLNGMRYICS